MRCKNCREPIEHDEYDYVHSITGKYMCNEQSDGPDGDDYAEA